MRAFGKTGCGTSSGNSLVNDDVVTESLDDLLFYGYIIASGAMIALGKTGLGTGSGNSLVNDNVVAESFGNLLFYGCIIASGAMRTFGKTGFGTGSGNGLVDNNVVIESRLEYVTASCTGLRSGTGCRCSFVVAESIGNLLF